VRVCTLFVFFFPKPPGGGSEGAQKERGRHSGAPATGTAVGRSRYFCARRLPLPVLLTRDYLYLGEFSSLDARARAYVPEASRPVARARKTKRGGSSLSLSTP